MSVVARLDRQVAAALRRAGYSGADTTIVVAVSGGPDSSALLHSLSRLKDRHRLKLHVAHLIHDFRGEESAQDAAFTLALAQELGLPATVERRNPWEYQQRKQGKKTSSYEQAARELRYSFLAEVAGGAGARVVAVGHTADDLAETTLLHLLRGAGIHGLRGMTELSPWPFPTEGQALTLFRPILGISKAETEAYCRELGREYREDSENRLPKYTRNRVRHQLMPVLEQYNPRVKEALLRLARTAALEVDFLEQATNEAWERAALPAEDSTRGFCLQREALASLHPLMQRMVLRRAYAAVKGDTRRLHESSLTAMTRLAQKGSPGDRLDLPEGLSLRVDYQTLFLGFREKPTGTAPLLEGEHVLPLPGPEDRESQVVLVGGWRVEAQRVTEAALVLPTDPMTACLRRDALEPTVMVRGRKPGDRFQPLGMAGEKKLQDFFTDARVPRWQRDRVPLLVSGGRIAWVVGHRIAEWAKVPSASAPPGEVVRIAFTVATEG